MSEQKGQKKQVQIQVRADDDVAQGIYANMAMVNHTDAEFTIDFVYIQPQAPQAKIRSRIITSPKHLKRLVAALQDNLARYEAKYGTVDMAVPPPQGQFKH